MAGGHDDVGCSVGMAVVRCVPELALEPISHHGSAESFTHGEAKARADNICTVFGVVVVGVIANAHEQRPIGVDLATAIDGAEIIAMPEPLLAAHGDSAVRCWFT
jgi:hypothetical protein